MPTSPDPTPPKPGPPEPSPPKPSPQGPVLAVPGPALVAVIGAAAAGKRTFAGRHFPPDDVLTLPPSGMDPAGNATAQALGALEQAAGERLARGLSAVVVAPLVRPDDRRRLTALARAHDLPAIAIVLDLPRAALEARQATRPAGPVTPEGLTAQVAELRRTLPGLTREGFRHAWILRHPEDVQAAHVTRVPLPPDRRDRTGPFDFIGDVHGCHAELTELLAALGYSLRGDDVTPPPGRTAVFLGDLVDRGPDSAGVLRLVMGMVRSGAALAVRGNHDEKLARALDGRAVRLTHGLDVTLAQVNAAGDPFREDVRAFIAALGSHLVLDGGRVVAAHAGLPEAYHGRTGGRVLNFALYGDVDGTRDDAGLPVRRDWAAAYHGAALVVYGHTPHATPRRVNGTVNIDTGCAFGGHLTALRYPEGQLLSVPARATYATPPRPLPTPDAP